MQMVTILQKTPSGQREIEGTLSSEGSDMYTISGLHPWTEYEFTVVMGNSSSPTHLVSDCPADSCITSEDGMHLHCMHGILRAYVVQSPSKDVPHTTRLTTSDSLRFQLYT